MIRLRRRPLLATLALAAIPGEPLAQGAEHRFGALFPLSGPLALQGDESFRGLELAAEERNAAGGILGRPIRLLKADAVDATQAIAEIRRLLGAERAVAMFGTHASALSVAASQIAELQGIAYIEMGATADAITERGFRTLFRTCPRIADFAIATVEAVAESLAPALAVEAQGLRVSILAEDQGDAQAMAAAQDGALRAAGLVPVERLAYPARMMDFAPLLQRLRAANTQILLHSGPQGDIAPLFRAMQDAAWRPAMLLGTGAGYAMAETARAVGAGFEGVLTLEFSPFAVKESFAPSVPLFVEAYKGRYGSEPRSALSLANYAAGLIAFEAFHRAGSLDKDRIRAVMLAAEIAEGASPAGWGLRFDERGQNTRARPFLMQWQSGTLHVIGPEPAATARLRTPLGG
ncbi:ABC transporter substrate-binding protein [Plastoroseomonas arctica]|uniref:ABC transporter substrate-binding protein n=1 Tax=Plastoroseomonas arctica TaxID=1509237 RepID=A0AAF1JXP6_9PROT|nr:ABC transporter substrate-binding protein [Plastoroseomonas arctica]MBR0656401.1 ABC transporter substrate-binding protein [Plastoroseomonas arctica]